MFLSCSMECIFIQVCNKTICYVMLCIFDKCVYITTTSNADCPLHYSAHHFASTHQLTHPYKGAVINYGRGGLQIM